MAQIFESKKINKIISRDEIPCHTKIGCCVVNFDDCIGVGTHWVVMHIASKMIYYFDSYGLNPPQELINWSAKMKKPIYIQQFSISAFV